MTPPDLDQSSEPTPDEPDFDAFLEAAARSAARQDLFHQVADESIIAMLYAARKYGIDMGSEEPTDTIKSPAQAKVFRFQFAESVMTLNIMHANEIEDENQNAAAIATTNKKKVMAGYITTGCMRQGDDWFKLLDEVTPGEALDENNLDDSPYFIEAIEQLQTMQAHQPAYEEIEDRVLSLIEEHAAVTGIDLESLERIVFSIITIFEESIDDSIHMQMRIDEMIRNEQLNPAYAEELKRLGAEYHALTAITG